MTPASAKGPKASTDYQFEPSPGQQENHVLIEESSLPMLNIYEELGGIDKALFLQRANERYVDFMRGYFG
jgi:hypothetical protein